ncbi:MAG: cell division protein ZapE [Burkholderiaceae bacterium]
MRQNRESVLARYQALLDERGFTADEAQLSAARRLETMAADLVTFKEARKHRVRRMLKPPTPPRGVWLYGGVGRGKSFLMDCFFNVLPFRRKTRIHFHEFMRGVHRELNELKGQADPLKVVARRIAKRYRVICFDEFHVSDIADAMILERLFGPLFDAGTCFVITSNYVPDSLYPDGLHRDRILPAIARLNQELDLVQVDTGVDYRQQSLAGVQAYHWPIDEASHKALRKAFESLTEAGDEEPVLHIEHREIAAVRRAGGVVWFDFETLCMGPRSQNDYLEIARQFHTVFLSGVPEMKPAMSSAARRFLWLIDVLYDQRVTLFVSAQCPPEGLYTEGPMVQEFVRTASRLVEMQSAEYLAAPRRGVAERIS